MRLMLLTALAVWIASNFLFVAWMRWRAGAPSPRNLREGDRINYEIEPHPSGKGGPVSEIELVDSRVSEIELVD